MRKMLLKSFAVTAVVAALARAQTSDYWTDSQTGIKFWQTRLDDSKTQGGYQFGMVLPEPGIGLDDEYIGQLIGPLHGDNMTGWSGVSHGGPMTNSLLLVAWMGGPEAQMRYSFKYATQNVAPDLYAGTANLTQISQVLNSTHFNFIYRCQGCWSWDQNGSEGSQSPASDSLNIGWAQSMNSPTDPDDDNSAIPSHDNGMGVLTIAADSARQSSYTRWMTLVDSDVTFPTGTGEDTATAAAVSGTASSTPADSSATTTGTASGATSTGMSATGGGGSGTSGGSSTSETSRTGGTSGTSAMSSASRSATAATVSSGAGRRMNIFGFSI